MKIENFEQMSEEQMNELLDWLFKPEMDRRKLVDQHIERLRNSKEDLRQQTAELLASLEEDRQRFATIRGNIEKLYGKPEQNS